MTDLPRRRVLQSLLAGAALAPAASLSFGAGAPPASGTPRRLVLVVLRGGLDGLGAVPAVGDPAFAEARGALAQHPTPTLPLTGPFALHPNLSELHTMFGRGEAAVVHATGLPYRERSHFDAQQVLESGGTQPHQITTGWLARALGVSGQRGMALNTAVPLVLRGPGQVDTWAPSVLPEPSTDLVARLEHLYAGDPALAQALARARGLRQDAEMGSVASSGMGGAGGGRQAIVALARKAGEFIARPGGPQVAVLEMGGWDTHANQAAPQGALANNLRTLDASLAALREVLVAPDAHDAWSRTVVVVVTEFGREVAINGTMGTDHGTGGAAFVLGGAVRGGRVIADWPGLAKADRFEGRDLRITTDLRAVLRHVLHDHLRVSAAALDRDIFPGSAGLKSPDLIRA
jgi:uncharacterized protein (DUF1501 family)